MSISFDDYPVQKAKKKQGKANGFLMFMLEYKRNEERMGNFMDMTEAQDKAGELWKVINWLNEDKREFA